MATAVGVAPGRGLELRLPCYIGLRRARGDCRAGPTRQAVITFTTATRLRFDCATTARRPTFRPRGVMEIHSFIRWED